MGYIDVSAISLTLPDGRPVLDEVTFRVGAGSTSALIGPNGAGKMTLLRTIRDDRSPDGGVVTIDGGLARPFDRFLVFGTDGDVYESDAPVWDERRVARARRAGQGRGRHDAEGR